jgi:hypothetical protein
LEEEKKYQNTTARISSFSSHYPPWILNLQHLVASHSSLFENGLRCKRGRYGIFFVEMSYFAGVSHPGSLSFGGLLFNAFSPG